MAKGGKGAGLSKEVVVREALSLIDEQGCAACSMRALATRLGVTAMALYGYVPSREALMGEACELFLRGVDARPIAGERWDDTLMRVMGALRRACTRHPHFGELLCDAAAGGGLEPYMMRLRGVFLAQGMPEDVAIQLTATADAFLAGFLLRAAQRLGEDGPSGPHASSMPADARPSFAARSRVPGMLTGRAAPAPPSPNERWRQTVAAGYSQQAFDNGLFVIVQGIRACVGADADSWRTSARGTAR